MPVQPQQATTDRIFLCGPRQGGGSTIVEVNNKRLEAARAVAGFANMATGASTDPATGETPPSVLVMSGNIEDMPGLEQIAAVIATAMQSRRAGYTSTPGSRQLLPGRVQERRAPKIGDSRHASTGASSRSPGEVADVDVQLQLVCNGDQHALWASFTHKGQAYRQQLTRDQATVPKISSLFIQNGCKTVTVKMRFSFPSPRSARQGIPPAKFLQIIAN